MSERDLNVLKGLDALVNPENIKPGIDLKELEKQMVSGGMLETKSKDPQDRFNEEVRDTAKRLGLDFGDKKKKKSKEYADNSKTVPRDREYNSSNRDHYSEKNNRSSYKYSGSSANKYSDDYTRNSGTYDYRTSNDSPKFDTIQYDDSSSDSEPSVENDDYGNKIDYAGLFSRDKELATRTQEEERRHHIDSVIGSKYNSDFTFESEKREDMKCSMLATIDSLIEALKEEEVDLSRVPTVDRKSKYAEIESVLKILRHKNDHARYCSFANEFILFGANACEELFDGKRTWFGKYSPDLTGWSNHVNVKLRRMSNDTSQIVSNVMHDYNIGPGFRVMLELLPSMVLYSKMRKHQHNKPGIYTDEMMDASTQNIQNIR